MESQAFNNEQMAYAKLMYAVMDELGRASKKFPNQTLPWGGDPGRFWLITGPIGVASQIQRAVVDAELRNGTATWFDVIAEEFLEAGAESGKAKDPSDNPQVAHDRLKAELIQVAAMALRAAADLDKQRAEYLKRMDGAESGGYNSSVIIGPDYQLRPDGRVVRREYQGTPSWVEEHVSREAESLLPPGGKHSGNCVCGRCIEPEPWENQDIPPNAGSAT